MISIEDSQFKQYLQRQPGSLADRLYEHLLDTLPDELRGIPRHLVLAMIELGLARARGHGLHSDEALCGFVTVMFEIAPNFDREPLLAQVLKQPHRLPEDNWQALFSGEPALQQAWERAAHPRFYDAAAWLGPAGAPGNGVSRGAGA